MTSSEHTRQFTPEDIARAQVAVQAALPAGADMGNPSRDEDFYKALPAEDTIDESFDTFNLAPAPAQAILVISSAPPEGMDYKDFEKVPWIARAREDAWERCDRRHGATPLVWNAYGVSFAATWMSVLAESVARGETLPPGVTWLRAGSALGLAEPRYGLRELFLGIGAGVIG